MLLREGQEEPLVPGHGPRLDPAVAIGQEQVDPFPHGLGGVGFPDTLARHELVPGILRGPGILPASNPEADLLSLDGDVPRLLARPEPGLAGSRHASAALSMPVVGMVPD